MNGRLHPQAAALFEGIFKPPAIPAPPTIEGMRATSETITTLLVGPGEDVFRTWDSMVEFQGRSISLRWYIPYAEEPTLLTVVVHGGGWVTGTLDSYDTLCRSLALRSAGMVLSIAYSLSPEVRFPTALDEVAFIFEQAPMLAQSFGYTPTRLALVGDSSGGQLIASTLDRIAETGATPPDKAVFLYPVLDASMSHSTWQSMGTGYNLTATRMRWYWEQYAGAEFLSHAVSPKLSPLQSSHLGKFPQSLVVTAEFDPLSGEGIQFAERLAEASVKAEHLHVPGQIHGFMRFRKTFTDPAWGVDAVMERIGKFLRD